MSDVGARLTLDALRRYLAAGGMGRLLLPADAPDWSAALGPAVNDSRNATPGSLFVALPGEHVDGHRFAAAAAAQGAAVVLVTRVPDDLAAPSTVVWLAPDPLQALQDFARWWRGQFPDLIAIGITGSVGKTTTKDVIAAALATRMPVLASPRSFNNEIGLPLTLLSLGGEHRAAVLEMGIYDVGDIAFLSAIARQSIGVVLNVDAVHLERAGSIERIAAAKQEIVTTLPTTGVAVLNADDRRVAAMRAAAPGLVLTFGFGENADWRGIDVRPDVDGLDLTLSRGGTHYALRSPLRGRHHAVALLAAAATLEAAYVPVAEIVPALAAVQAPAARQKFLRGAGDRVIIDDTYNASPLSMAAALDLLASRPASRRVAILADMLELGSISEESHRAAGEHAAASADLVIAVGPRARTIAGAAGSAAMWFPDKPSLRHALGSVLGPGDVILVKGSRGMAMEEVVEWLVAAP
jgi:UDP-N-acetylmuramoyl-tripeptide--D-alanyl-D-alanine ligase